MSFNLSLTDEASFALNVSLSVARDSGHSKAELKHVASALFLMDESIGCTVVAMAGQSISGAINVTRLKRNLEKVIQKTPSEDPLPLEATLSLDLETRLSSEGKKISVEDLLLIVYEDDGVKKVLETKYKLSKDVINQVFTENRIHEKLDKYSIDLVKAARAGKIDKVVGRYEEIRDTVNILSSDNSQNNVYLVGEPHVDVIAVVEGLALRICQGIIPDQVNVSLRALNLDAIINETSGLQEMQGRLQEVLNNVKELKGRIIFFIDELHLVLGDESVEGLDSADLIRPFIENDDIRMIGAIYTGDYPALIENDSVFAQSFQKVDVDELSLEAVFANSENAVVSRKGALDGSNDTFNESRDNFDFDGNLSFGMTSSFMNAAQISDRYIVMNNEHGISSDQNGLRKDGSRRMLLRPQQTVSERYLSFRDDELHAEVSPAANNKKCPIRISRPANIVALERKISILEMEREALKRNDESEENRNIAILEDIAKLKKQLEPLLINWQAQHVKELQSAQKNLESLQSKAINAERSGDFDKAANLKFGTIPALRTRIQELAKVFGR